VCFETAASDPGPLDLTHMLSGRKEQRRIVLMNEPPVKKLDIDRDAVVDRLLRRALRGDCGGRRRARASTPRRWRPGRTARSGAATAPPLKRTRRCGTLPGAAGGHGEDGAAGERVADARRSDGSRR